MIIKNLDLLRCVSPMKLLCDKENIPFLAAIAISKNVSAIDNAIEAYMKKKDELNQKYLNNEGAAPTVKAGFEEEYLRLITELNNDSVNIPIESIDPDTLSSITFPPKFIQCIDFMLDI
ncbi:MAG: hypothetical protein IJN17_07520 [Clostridia bacterium]|nr:hypothetical protein [Clostridia bacterium]